MLRVLTLMRSPRFRKVAGPLVELFAFVVVGAVAAVAAIRSSLSLVVPVVEAGDPASDALQALAGTARGWFWEGPHSDTIVPHPGPFSLILRSMSFWFAGGSGDLPTPFGATLAVFTASIVLFVALAGFLVGRVLGSVLWGALFVSGVLASSVVRAGDRTALHLWDATSVLLLAVVLYWGARRRYADVLFVAVAGIWAQQHASALPLGLALLGIAALRTWTFRRVLTRRDWIAFWAVWAVSVAPFAIRLIVQPYWVRDLFYVYTGRLASGDPYFTTGDGKPFGNLGQIVALPGSVAAAVVAGIAAGSLIAAAVWVRWRWQALVVAAFAAYTWVVGAASTRPAGTSHELDWFDSMIDAAVPLSIVAIAAALVAAARRLLATRTPGALARTTLASKVVAAATAALVSITVVSDTAPVWGALARGPLQASLVEGSATVPVAEATLAMLDEAGVPAQTAIRFPGDIGVKFDAALALELLRNGREVCWAELPGLMSRYPRTLLGQARHCSNFESFTVLEVVDESGPRPIANGPQLLTWDVPVRQPQGIEQRRLELRAVPCAQAAPMGIAGGPTEVWPADRCRDLPVVPESQIVSVPDLARAADGPMTPCNTVQHALVRVFFVCDPFTAAPSDPQTGTGQGPGPVLVPANG